MASSRRFPYHWFCGQTGHIKHIVACVVRSFLKIRGMLFHGGFAQSRFPLLPHSSQSIANASLATAVSGLACEQYFGNCVFFGDANRSIAKGPHSLVSAWKYRGLSFQSFVQSLCTGPGLTNAMTPSYLCRCWLLVLIRTKTGMWSDPTISSM